LSQQRQRVEHNLCGAVVSAALDQLADQIGVRPPSRTYSSSLRLGVSSIVVS
jgi:hypothetical protein